ncbi:flagellar assembly protein FliW [Bdellovibrionota bacterium FG-2]
MIIKTGRFGQLTIGDEELIQIPQGVFGFPEYTRFALVDPGDETLILWLQSLENLEIAFPVLEPKLFRMDYAVRLSGAELRELKLDNVNQSAVFSILTIPEDITQMTANLKAPIVVNLKEQIAKQVVLQENEYTIKHPMFKELRAHLITINSQKRAPSVPSEIQEQGPIMSPVAIRNIPPSLTVKTLHG